MKDTIIIILGLMLFASAIVFAIFQGYLFYFAECNEVKQWWFIVQTPARCID